MRHDVMSRFDPLHSSPIRVFLPCLPVIGGIRSRFLKGYSVKNEYKDTLYPLLIRETQLATSHGVEIHSGHCPPPACQTFGFTPAFRRGIDAARINQHQKKCGTRMSLHYMAGAASKLDTVLREVILRSAPIAFVEAARG